jgi:hypothetical protein
MPALDNETKHKVEILLQADKNDAVGPLRALVSGTQGPDGDGDCRICAQNR